MIFDPNKDFVYGRRIHQDKLFCSTDTYERFKKHKLKFGKNWYYYDNPINYKFNSLGYRAIEFDELKNGFIAAFGCSYTMGIGLHNEDIWINKLCKKLNKQPLNLGLEGVGNNISYINNINLFKYCKKKNIKPEAIIVQLTFNERREFYNSQNDELHIVLSPYNTVFDYEKEDHSWFINRYVPDSSERSVMTYINLNAITLLWNSINIPVYFWSFTEDFDNGQLKFLPDQEVLPVGWYDHFSGDLTDKDRARDVGHNGRVEHELASELLIKKYFNG